MQPFNHLFFHELIHLLLSLIPTIILYRKFKDFKLIFICLLTGVFIDFDHWFDYFYWAGLHVNLDEFFDPAYYVLRTNKVFVLLHGWEYLPLFYLMGKRSDKRIPGLKYALVVPYVSHLLFDQFVSAGSPLSYFLIYRFLNNFRLSAFNKI